MKHTAVMVLLLYVTNMSYAQERHLISLSRNQLRCQEQHGRDERVREWRTKQKKEGMREVLKFLPLCAVGFGIYFNALYTFSNSDQMCWVKPVPLAEQCKFLWQTSGGLAISTTSIVLCGRGCNQLFESQICQEEDCCKECCALCIQEGCGLLGSCCACVYMSSKKLFQ
jgi:hypothetical protein